MPTQGTLYQKINGSLVETVFTHTHVKADITDLPNILNLTAAGTLNWNSAGSGHTDNLRLINANTLAYWNGSYYSNGASNLEYVKLGKLGNAAIKNMDTALSTTSENPVQNKVITAAINGKAASSHTHSNIVTIGDQRSVATKPSDYGNKISFAGLKSKATVDNPSNDIYSYVVGLMGWADTSGGNAHELAFNNSGINHRIGTSGTAWSSWKKIAYTDSDITGNAATATKATQDGNGNNIVNTYAPKATTLAGYNISDAKINNGVITLGSNTITPITTLANNTRSVEFIKGTQTAATGSWTGVTADSSLYDGKTILYFLPYAGSGNASLNLTLAGGTTTGAIEVWATGSTRCTTHYGVNSTILLTYIASLNRWTRCDYWNGNNYDRLLCTYFIPYVGSAYYAYRIGMLGTDGRLYPINTTDGTGTSKAVSTVGVHPDMAWCYMSTTAVDM